MTPACRAEYERAGGRQHGDRIIRCHLPTGHPGEHEEADTEITWTSVVADQPPPVPAIADLVMADLRERKQVGIQRYGTPLQPHNGRDALIDAYQEAMDLTLYLRQAIEERPAAAVPGTGDRGQPYPTADAYEVACAALERHRQRADAAEAERDEAHNAVVETRRLATKAMIALRTKVLTALGREDDGRTLMTEYVDALAAELDKVRAEAIDLTDQLGDLRATVAGTEADLDEARSVRDRLAPDAGDEVDRFLAEQMQDPAFREAWNRLHEPAPGQPEGTPDADA